MSDLIINCYLCEEQALHIIGEAELKTEQCINCGYASTDKFKGTMKDNETFKTLSEEMQSWAKESNDSIWIPSMITLPFGTLYPINVDGKMKWACAEMVDIPEDKQNKYPREDGNGFHTKKYDTDNQRVFDVFIESMSYMNEIAKQNSVSESKIKLPKLKRHDG